MKIRFASIPKCASRSLKALGLLGELEGRCHTRIHDYPDWQKYHWMAVDRPADDWYRSWWIECRDMKSMFADWMGFKYESFEADMKCLEDFDGTKTGVPLRWGINQWVPEHFSESYFDHLMGDGHFKSYCFDSIVCGVKVEIIQLADLDAWLIKNGIVPIHENKREGVSEIC